MKMIRLIKPALFIYEFIRILILAAALVINSSENDIFGQIVYTAPNALFPLMALFIWLNQERYKAYLPLFLAGKCIAISTTLVFSAISGQTTMTGSFVDFGYLLGFDLLAIAAVIMINRDIKKNLEITTVENTEELLPRGGNSD